MHCPLLKIVNLPRSFIVSQIVMDRRQKDIQPDFGVYFRMRFFRFLSYCGKFCSTLAHSKTFIHAAWRQHALILTFNNTRTNKLQRHVLQLALSQRIYGRATHRLVYGCCALLCAMNRVTADVLFHL